MVEGRFFNESPVCFPLKLKNYLLSFKDDPSVLPRSKVRSVTSETESEDDFQKRRKVYHSGLCLVFLRFKIGSF